MNQHTTYDIKEIATIVDGKLLQASDNTIISQLALDSRKILKKEGTLFFAIKGKRHDGHDYIPQLYGQGVRHFIVTTNKEEYKDFSDASFILVKNSTLALQALTAFHRRLFHIPVIGITGSNGKTVVKEWLSQLLDEDYNIIKSPKSYNSQIGVPLSVWMMNDRNSLGIFEAGISQPDEMEQLEKVIQPTIGIFTNIGEAHAEGFLNIRHKIKEKLRLFINSKIIIYCKDYHDINQCISEVRHQYMSNNDEENRKFSVFVWSRKQKDAELFISNVAKSSQETHIEGIYKGKELKITIPFSDDASIENAIHCWATLLYLNISQASIQQRILHLGKVAMRLELKEAIENCSLINDSYNSDFGSLKIAVDFLHQQQQHPKKTIILSDILQSGKDEQELYAEVSGLLGNQSVKRLIGVGEAISRQQQQFKKIEGLDTRFFKNTDELLSKFGELTFKDETILLKGARKFSFEKISRMLEQKIHETVLEINLNAIAHNLEVYHSLLKPETRIMAMVKAFSYGSGSFEIANVLQFHRVHYLAVAYADEGVELRKAGIGLPIMVMNPEERSFDTIINYRLEPEIYSFALLDRFEKELSNFGATSPFPVHIKLDTGMYRLGFLEKDIPELKKRLSGNPSLKVQSVFSHMAASDAEQHKAFTEGQIQQFERMSAELQQVLPYKFDRHIANSGGIVRYPESHFDMVRLGLGLYGIDTTGEVQPRLQAVGRLKATISQIKEVPASHTIGYDRKGKAKKTMRIAVVGIGYADGIDRRLSNGVGSMYIGGKAAPIVGNVCMDMCMLDISKIPDAKEGDEVIVFGKEQSISTLAAQMGTIPYELLTGISQRVKRIYFQE